MKQNKKGFTLIELLAVIVILAIIALITTPLIMDVINDAKEGAMEQNKRTMERAGELFIWDDKNKGRAPKMNGDRTYIQLEELENGYMKKIQGDCEGYVAVDNETGEYYYTAYLDCGDGNALYVDSEYVNYGGKYVDQFNDAIKTKDGGFITVGDSNSPNFGTQKNHNDDVTKDAIIVKYDQKGKIEWENHFGGSKNDTFQSVIEVNDGYLIVGTSYSKDGDMNNLKTNNTNLIIVKYSKTGKLLDKKIVSTSKSGGAATGILEMNDKFYVIGRSRGNPTEMELAMVACLNQNLEIEWKKFYGGTYVSGFHSIVKLDNDSILVGGYSQSIDGDMADIKIGEQGVPNAILFELNAKDGTIQRKFAYDQFTNILDIEVYNNFYILNGNSKLVKTDAITGGVVKAITPYSITSLQKVTDGILYTNFGRNNNDKQQIKFSLLDTNLEVKKEKIYQTTEYTAINRVLEENNSYYAFGMSFSTTDNFETFNYGNSDAILMKLDRNLELKEDFKLQTLLKIKMPELVKNYGTKIPTPEDMESLKIYTTNDTTREIGSWCEGNLNYLDPNANYRFPNCLFSFNTQNRLSLGTKAIYQENSSNHIKMNVSPKDFNHWLLIQISYGNAGRDHELSNLKIQFEGTEEVTVQKAVELGYIEPLVVSGYLRVSDSGFFKNSYDLLLGKSSGPGTYPILNIYLKPKNKKLVSISFDTKYLPSSFANRAFVYVSELYHFDMSLTPAKSE